MKISLLNLPLLLVAGQIVHHPDIHQATMQTLTMSDNAAIADGAQSSLIESRPDPEGDHTLDNELLVHKTPRDYAGSARRKRERLIAEGTDPNNVLLQSELFTRKAGETVEDFTRRLSAEMKAARDRGAIILNDMSVADVKPDFFQVRGKAFDLGRNSGVTRGEYREFGEWFVRVMDEKEDRVLEVPERWRKFEKPVEEDDFDRFPRGGKNTSDS
jgi:hypothetical protein